MEKQRLIDFCKYLEKEGGSKFVDSNWLVDNYLKSINEASVKARSVSKNEGKQEFCYCLTPDYNTGRTYCCRCGYPIFNSKTC